MRRAATVLDDSMEQAFYAGADGREGALHAVTAARLEVVECLREIAENARKTGEEYAAKGVTYYTTYCVYIDAASTLLEAAEKLEAEIREAGK